MNPNIDKILEDLYALDPTLRKREQELIPLLEKLLRAQPKHDIDDAFVTRLRNRLLLNPMHTKQPSPIYRTFTLAATFAALALAVAVPTTYHLTQSGTLTALFNEGSTATNVRTVGESAFGSLLASSGTAGGMGGGGMETRSAVADDAKRTSIAVGEPYVTTRYAYVYNGELVLPGDTGTVYKKTAGLQLPGNYTNGLGKADLDIVDLGSFSGLQPQYITLRQDDRNGYTVSLDAMYGSISISANEGHWDNPGTSTGVPSEEQVIETAQSFLSRYGVDTSSFGTPRVDETSMLYARDAIARGETYAQYINVTWPMLVDGKEVLNGSGGGHGISVTVNTANGDVTSAYISITSAVEGSSYTLETDSDRIMKAVSQGSIYGGWYGAEADKTVTVELGEPELVLTTHSTYDANTGKSEELYVPALSFPIINVPEGEQIYSTAVVIPLAKDIFDSADAQGEPEFRILDSEKAAQ